MSIAVVCGSCGKEYKVADKYAGRQGKCKECGEAFVVPGTAAVTMAAANAPTKVVSRTPAIKAPAIAPAARSAPGRARQTKAAADGSQALPEEFPNPVRMPPPMPVSISDDLADSSEIPAPVVVAVAVPPPMPLQYVTPPPESAGGKSFAKSAAQASVVCPLLAWGIGMFLGQMPQEDKGGVFAFSVAGVAFLLLLGGLTVGIIALVKRRGQPGILGWAITGVVINSLLVVSNVVATIVLLTRPHV